MVKVRAKWNTCKPVIKHIVTATLPCISNCVPSTCRAYVGPIGRDQKPKEKSKGKISRPLLGTEKVSRVEIYLDFILKRLPESTKRCVRRKKGLIIRLMYEQKVNSCWISCLIFLGFLQFFMFKWAATTTSTKANLLLHFREYIECLFWQINFPS